VSRGKRNGRERITEGSYIGIVVLMILQSQKQKTHIRKSVKGKKGRRERGDPYALGLCLRLPALQRALEQRPCGQGRRRATSWHERLL